MDVMFENNCINCKYKMYGMVIRGHNTENYVSPLEFQQSVIKYGYSNCILTGNVICNKKGSVSYQKEVLQKYKPSDDFVINCTEFKSEGGET